jgi:hypothetical protein
MKEMMMDYNRKAIDAVMVGDVSKFKQHIETELNARAANALHQKKLEISVDSVQVHPAVEAPE